MSDDVAESILISIIGEVGWFDLDEDGGYVVIDGRCALSSGQVEYLRTLRARLARP